jgi:hypothetical protein
VVLVGDRGMITEARLTTDIKAAGLDWITALRGPAIKDLLNSGALQLTRPDAKIAVLIQDSLAGEDYLGAVKAVLGGKADTMIVKELDLPGHRHNHRLADHCVASTSC